MAEEADPTASAAEVTRAALAARYEAVVAADQVLAAAVTDAHNLAVEALGRLDAIGVEIENAVTQQHLLALDTSAGAREFQRFLLDKHRDIIAVVTRPQRTPIRKFLDCRGLSTTTGQWPNPRADRP